MDWSEDRRKSVCKLNVLKLHLSLYKESMLVVEANHDLAYLPGKEATRARLTQEKPLSLPQGVSGNCRASQGTSRHLIPSQGTT